MIFSTGVQQIHSPSASDLRTLGEQFHHELWTGLVEAEMSGVRVVFLFADGIIKCSYHIDFHNVQKKDAEAEWASTMRSSPEKVAYIPLDPPALRLLKVYLEHPSPAEALLVEDGRLAHVFDQWLQQAHPNLGVTKWLDGQGLVMLWPGNSRPPCAVLVSARGSWQGADAFGQILSSGNGECDAFRHAFVSDGNAWDEYSFQHMFVLLLDALLKRYKDLTGLALLNALDRNINRIALEHKWDFNITLGVISDRMLFASLDETLSVCKTLLSVACEHIGVVLGQKLLRSLIEDAIISLDHHSIQLIEKYSVDALLGAPRVALAGEKSHE